jgi:hypothetical protein
MGLPESIASGEKVAKLENLLYQKQKSDVHLKNYFIAKKI